MSDNIYELKYKTPMNDLPEQGEVVTEKPYYESTPILKSQEKNETKQKKCELEKKEKIALIMYIIFLILLIVDIVVEVCCKIFDPWLLPDNIAGVGITIVLVIYFIIKRTIYDSNGTLLWVSGIILIVGSVAKFVGLFMLELKKKAISKGNGSMVGVIFLTLGKLVFLCISFGNLCGN